MKKNGFTYKVLTTLFAIIFSAEYVYAVPAYFEPTQYVQPDGSVIDLYTYGDEYYNFIGDADGYMLEKDENGKYEYVTSNSPAMRMSAFNDSDSRPANAVKGFDMRDETSEPLINSIYPYTYYPPISLFGTEGENTQIFNLITIAVEFNDVKFPQTGFSGKDIYDRIYSSEEGVISVRNYYDEVSSGILQVIPAFEVTEDDLQEDGYGKVADGVVKVVIDGNHPDPQTYSGKEQDEVIAKIIKDSIDIVDEYIDFNDYDIDTTLDVNGKGFLWDYELAFCFIIAGQEASADKTITDNSVWAHRYYVPGGIVCDGLNIFEISDIINEKGENESLLSTYAMMGAMYDTTNPMGIGALCHEIGHIIGFPDLYNTEGTEDYGAVGTLSLMANGSWGMQDANAIPSSMPTYIDPWCKIIAKWYKYNEIAPINIAELADGYTPVTKILPLLSNKTGYRCVIVRTNESNEYFILENRGFAGFDEALKYLGVGQYPPLTSSGIAVWHIDEDIIMENMGDNAVNTSDEPGISLVRSGFGSEFYNSSKPLWSLGMNRLSYFGKISYPSSALNTYTDSSDSGVELEFLSPSTDEMYVRFGNNKRVKKALYSNNENVSVRLFNTTDAEVTVTPVVAKYNGTTLDDIAKLTELTLAPGETKKTDIKSFSIERARKYKVFGIDFSNLKPEFEPFYFEMP